VAAGVERRGGERLVGQHDDRAGELHPEAAAEVPGTGGEVVQRLAVELFSQPETLAVVGPS